MKIFLGILVLLCTWVSAETSLIFSYNDYSCGWEIGTSGYTELTHENSFRMITNVAVYAARGRSQVTMAQVVHNGDWNCDGAVIDIVQSQITARVSQMTTILSPAKNPNTDDLSSIDLLVIMGHDSFSFTQAGLNNIKAFLDRGGVLFADDCNQQPTGPFATSLKSVVQTLYGVEFSNLDPYNPVYKTYYNFDGNNSSYTPEGYGTQWATYQLQGLSVYTPNLPENVIDWPSTPEPMSIVFLAIGILGVFFKKYYSR